jgi:hypothetical protein
MTNLNSAVSRDLEYSRVPRRAAIVNVAKDFDLGGPFRMLTPDYYEFWHYQINIAGIGLEALAGFIRITAEVQDQAAFDLADQLSSVAEWFLEFEEVWCRTVSDPSPYPIARCYEHDGIVPVWSQAYDYPRLPLIIRRDGPIHLHETRTSDDQLVEALAGTARVALRPDPPPLAPPPAPTEPPADDPPPTEPPPPDDPPPPSDSPPPPPPTGRFKLEGDSCVWDPNDSGPDQCSPLPPTGRYKLDGAGGCYWEPNDYPPDQCSPATAPTGRFKLDGAGGCYWYPNDSGPDQCAP